MSRTDAEWLRERPEIVDTFQAARKTADKEGIGWNRTELDAIGIAAILPHLRAAIRADVVRELAGDAREVATEIGHSTAVQTCCNNPVRGKNGEPECCGEPDVQFIFTADTEDRIATALSAAHAQGRAAGREEAAGDIEDADPQLAEFIRKRSLP